jgi:hypothetical protein
MMFLPVRLGSMIVRSLSPDNAEQDQDSDHDDNRKADNPVSFLLAHSLSSSR